MGRNQEDIESFVAWFLNEKFKYYNFLILLEFLIKIALLLAVWWLLIPFLSPFSLNIALTIGLVYLSLELNTYLYKIRNARCAFSRLKENGPYF